MKKEITINSGSWQKDLDLKITIIDEEKFNRECEVINNFFCGSESRVRLHGSAVKAGLALFAAECFQQMAFNDFKCESWLVEQFNWGRPDGNGGVEGFPSIPDLGIEINSIDPWSIDSEDITFQGF